MLKFFSTLRSRLILIIILTAVPGILLLVQVGLNQFVIRLEFCGNLFLLRFLFLLDLARFPQVKEDDHGGNTDGWRQKFDFLCHQISCLPELALVASLGGNHDNTHVNLLMVITQLQPE